MNKAILVVIFGILFALQVYAPENVYLITLQKNNNGILLNGITLAEGPGSDYIDQPQIGYKAILYSFKHKKLLEYLFEMKEVRFIEPPIDLNSTSTELPIQNNYETILTFPYYPNAKKIEILDETGKLKLEIDLSGYARCNENDFCDFNEDMIRCPQDCRKEVERPVKEESLELEITEEEPAALKSEEPKENTLLNKLENQGISKNLLIIIAVLAIILILILILSRKKEK